MNATQQMAVRWLGRTRYADALALQRDLHVRGKSGEGSDVLLLTEHEPVFTFGRNARSEHLLVSEREVAERGIDLVRVERGGEITYHGPGQLVAYPILDLTPFGRDVRRYLSRLEEVGLRLLASYDLQAARRSGAPGLWVGERKIASVGVYISRWVTMHGIAINLDMDLAPFRLINPCGFAGLEMTSVARETGLPVILNDAAKRFASWFAEVFGVAISTDRSTPVEQRSNRTARRLQAGD